MQNSIITTGITGNSYKTLLRKQIMQSKPKAVGFAVAYISMSGFNIVKKILEDGHVKDVRLVTDVKDGITHPKALENAVDSGWKVRTVDSLPGTFHPKLYIGAAEFDDISGVTDICFAIVGSPNLSQSGFSKNGECIFSSNTKHTQNSSAKAWHDCWTLGVPTTMIALQEYEKYFAFRNRFRSPSDLIALGVADNIPEKINGIPKKGITPPQPQNKAFSERAASVAWVGLQSFTGEYSLQIEFPKQAGMILQRIVSNLSQNRYIEIQCADGKIRTFKFKFYKNNRMFRLSIPNSTPLVDWVRLNKKGIGLVEFNDKHSVLSFEILPPGQAMLDMVDRSLMLGTWGRTPTRLYGWY